MDKLSSLIIDKLNTGILVIDENQTIVMWNQWLEMYSEKASADVLGNTIADVFPIFQNSYYQQIFASSFTKGQSMFCSGAIHSVFIPHKSQNNKIIKQNMQVEPFIYQGRPYILLQVNDITNQFKQVTMLKEEIKERKRVESMIRKSEEEMKTLRDEAIKASTAKSDFLAMMSHEIRTPMNAIIGMAELLSDTELTEEQQEYVKIFQDAGDTLLRIINDILDLSKIEAGKIDQEFTEILLPEFLEDIVSMYSFQAYKNNLKFHYLAKTNLPQVVYGDSVRLRQVITNILSNAIKFTAAGTISMEVEHHELNDESIEFICKIQDTGIGIPEDKIHYIFEPFAQADSSITRRYGGTGLGLTIVNKLLESLNGKIQVKSKVDHGSTFIITIVLHTQQGIPNDSIFNEPIEGSNDREIDLQENEQQGTIEQGNNGTKHTQENNREVLARLKTGGPYRVLVAEDSPDNYKLLQLYVKDYNIAIDIVENGWAAIEQYKNQSYDLVIMDIEMPEIDGIEATKQIRNWEKSLEQQRTPIVAVTAHALMKYKLESLEAGCDDFLPKPIKKQEFLLMLNKLLPEK